MINIEIMNYQFPQSNNTNSQYFGGSSNFTSQNMKTKLMNRHTEDIMIWT